MKFERICVLGLGYIGLPTAATFAAHGLDVIGVDVRQDIVDVVNQGKIHIVEPSLDRVVAVAVESFKLRATTSPENADAFIVAVPTPFKEDHKPDLAYIEAAAKAIAPKLEKGNLIILESTSPVGTTKQMADWLAVARPDLSFPQQRNEDSDIRIAHCPERVLPGHIMKELIENDRIVGGMTPRCAKEACDLYKVFVKGECLVTNDVTAEMCKLTENSFRDVNIAFANELSIICDKIGINVWELIKLANRHPRVNILQPGPGVGGHCIAVDPWFIVSSAPQEAKLISTARRVNDEKPRWVIAKVKSAIAKSKKSPCVVACLGLAFKADIDDLRESPALSISLELAKFDSIKLLVVEPNVKEASIHGLQFSSIDEALDKADVVVILVDHYQFKSVDYSRFIKHEVLVDCRGISVERAISNA